MLPGSPTFLFAVDDPPAKRAILACALRRFVVDGLDGTSIRTVAADAGFTNPALFRHFTGKEELAAHLFALCYRRLAGCVAVPSEGPFLPRFEWLIGRYLAAYDESPEAVLYVQEQLRRFWPQVPAAAKRPSLIGALAALLKHGVQEGVVAADLDLRLAAGAVLGVLAQTARMLYFEEFGGGSATALAPQIVRLATGMLAPPTSVPAVSRKPRRKL